MLIVYTFNLVTRCTLWRSEMAQKIKRFVICIIILAAGAGVFAFFVTTRTEAERRPPGQDTIIVDVVAAEPAVKKTVISSMGTIIPARKIVLVPEVGGRIVFQSKNLVPGGVFRKGQVVLRVDARDYALAVKQQQAQVKKAEMDLALEQGRKAVAEKEWNLIRNEVKPTEAGRKLALRDAQVETAEAALAGAESRLSQAKLAEERTVLRAPFNAIVTEEFVDVGQVVGPSSQVATLVDSDKFWVRVAVPMDRLSWIRFPNAKGEGGSKATITQKIGNSPPVVRQGQVIRLFGDLDPVGKMARVLVEVENPVGEMEAETSTLPLLIGAYVSVDLEGPELDNVYALPRRGIRDGEVVWIKRGGKLEFRKVQVIWTEDQTVFVQGALEPGDEIVVSRIPAPVEGMRLSLEMGQEAESAEPGSAEPSAKEPAQQASDTPSSEESGKSQ